MKWGIIFGVLAVSSIEFARGRYMIAFGVDHRTTAGFVCILLCFLFLISRTFPPWE